LFVHAQCLVQLGDHVPVGVDDLHAVARGPRIAARAAVDVRRHHAEVPLSAAAGGGT